MTAHEMETLARAETKRYLEIAREIFKVDIPDIPVLFDIKSANMAGQACYSPLRIRYNTPMMVLNGMNFINRTVPHEVAHIVAKIVYGRCQKHNANWRRVYEKIGGTNVSRCHNYDTAGIVGKTKTKYDYRCGCMTHSVGPKIHKNIQTGARSYTCRLCQQQLATLTAVVAPVKPTVARVEVPRLPVAADTNNGTKKEQALALMRANPNLSRGEYIQLFMDKLNMGKAGASTYHQMLKTEV